MSPGRTQRAAWACMVLTVIGWARAAAQEPAAQAVSFGHVLRSVSMHHPLLLAEAASVRAADAETLAARGEFDPQLSVQARLAPSGYYDPKRIDAIVEQPTPLWGTSLYAGYRVGRGNIAPYYGEQRTLSHGELRAGVRLPLLQDGSTDARRTGVRAAATQRLASESAYEKTRLDLSRDAAFAYFSWLAAGRRLVVVEGLVELAQLRDAQIRDKVMLGALPRIEAVDNQRTLLDRKRQLILAGRAFEKASIDLSLFLRDAQGRPVVPGRDALPSRTADASRSLPPLERAIENALRQRPELSLAETQLELAELDRELAQNRVLPRWDVVGEVSKDFGTASEQVAQTLEPTVVEVGTLVSLPIGLRKARGKLRAALAKASAAEQKLVFARDKVRAEVQDAWSQLQAARERAAIARDAAEAADQVASGERERFELGATTVLFVNLREQAAADAHIAWVDAHADAELAVTRALLTMGEVVDSDAAAL